MLYSEISVRRPDSYRQALELLAEEGKNAKLLAGGTDLMIQLRSGQVTQKRLIDISRLDELKYVRVHENVIHIGALTTLSQCVSSPIVQKYAPILLEAVTAMGSFQTRNIGTIGGNIANASPAGDTIPPLYVLDGRIVMTSANGERTVSLTRFFRGPGNTVLTPCEMVKEILVRPMKPDEIGFFRKVGLRGAHAISLASVAAWLKRGRSDSVFTDARIALGAVGPTVMRPKSSETLVKEAPLTKDRLTLIADKAASECTPISDVRATAAYRRAIVAALVYQGLSEVLTEKQANW